MKKQSFISVVFVNFNGKGLLEKAIKSIKHSTTLPFEILVVDNNSTDGTQEMVREKFPNVKLIQNKENLGYTGINTALRHCNGKYLLFLNNDLEMEKNSVTELINAIEKNKKTALAVPKLVNYHDRKIDSAGTWISRGFYNGHYRSDVVDDNVKEIPYMGVGLIKMDVVRKFGYLFDSDYFIYAEDLDLGMRIRLLGMNTLYVPKASCFHMHSMTMKNTPNSKKTFLMERNLLTTFLKIPSFPRLLFYSPYVCALRITTVFRDIITLKFNIALARIYAFFFVIFHLFPTLKKRKTLQRMRTATDDYVFSIFTEKHLFSGKRLTI